MRGDEQGYFPPASLSASLPPYSVLTVTVFFCEEDGGGGRGGPGGPQSHFMLLAFAL